jgi:hypothetical protein
VGLLIVVATLIWLSLAAGHRSARFRDEPYGPALHIIGSEKFRARTRAALDLVRRTRHYAEVSRYVSVIQQADRSGMQADAPRPTFEVGTATWEADPIWYASTIVHDAVHSRL